VLGMLAPAESARRRDAAERLAALAPAEHRVALLLAEGLSNAAIARRLAMSESSVKTYVSRVLAKLGCDNRVQAALLVRDAAAGAPPVAADRGGAAERP